MAMQSQNTFNQLSRRKWLREMAIAATSVAVLPSLFTGCTDHVEPGKGLLGDPPITEGELRSAAQNLRNMNDWVEDVYGYTGKYEGIVLELLKSGLTPPPSFKDFIISIITDMAIGIIGVVAAGVPGLGPAIGAVAAIASENIKKWTAPGDRPHTLDGVYAVFALGHLQMQISISTMLLKLADETDNYRNLREGWKGEIDFNGQKYTLRDLANAQFPAEKKGTAYTDLRTAAYDQFRKYFWNLMIAKAGTINYSEWSILRGRIIGTPRDYGKNDFYTKDYQKANYLRGYQWRSPFLNDDYFYFSNWYFTFDGRELPAAAAKELFKDDVPGNIINPDGLFARDYVFKQFHTERISFQGYHDVRKDDGFGPAPLGTDCYGFDCPADDYLFTGGDFPQLIKK